MARGMVSAPDTIKIEQPLNFATVPALYREGRKLIAQRAHPLFDLAAVPAADNAGVALLVTWTRYALTLNREIKFINLTAQLLALVSANGLQEILPLN